MAVRIPACDAITGSTLMFVMNEMSSSSNRLMGSAMARVSVLPRRLTGRTSYFLAIVVGTRRSTSASTSSWDSVIEGIPYWCERNPMSCASVIIPRRMRTEPSLSVVPFCSASALRSCSGESRPSATSKSPKRRLTGCPSVACAIECYLLHSAQPLQRISESLIGIVLIQDEHHPAKAGRTALQMPDDLFHHGLG